ncbi:hypothetical protein [Massilia luteola]|jgi:hypothetical protein|uniref:hypothetical protein n=1 Tax=Massilia luteola TaxID=3081751 RepID=UPI002ACBFD10|nr:hypothetical protein [Massilia sp. Gc5]
MTVKVYRYAQYPDDHDETLSHGYATMEFIILNKLTPMSDSVMDVDPAHVAEDGRYLGLNGGKPA